MGEHTASMPAPGKRSGQHVLPPSHAFVVQFRAEAELDRGRYIGRVEHVVSGRAVVFRKPNELLDFLKQVLAAVRNESSGES